MVAVASMGGVSHVSAPVSWKERASEDATGGAGSAWMVMRGATSAAPTTPATTAARSNSLRVSIERRA